MTNLINELRELAEKMQHRIDHSRRYNVGLVDMKTYCQDFDELTAILDKHDKPKDLGKIPSRTKPKCEACDGTGFYGDNGPGIKGNKEFQPCDCGVENKAYIDLATAVDKSERAWGHLDAIWNALEMGYEWEYGGYLERHAIAKIRELKEENAKLQKICGMSTPWPIQSILHKLAECADILLDEKDYGGHGWELIHEARMQARTRIAALQENNQ